MGADIKIAYPDTLPVQGADNVGVDPIDISTCNHTLGHTRLIGYYEEQKVFLQLPQRVECFVKEDDIRRTAQMASVFNNGAISVEEYRSFLVVCHIQTIAAFLFRCRIKGRERLASQIERADIITFDFPEMRQAASLRVEHLKQFGRSVGDVFAMKSFDAVDLGQVLRHANGELADVIFF